MTSFTLFVLYSLYTQLDSPKSSFFLFFFKYPKANPIYLMEMPHTLCNYGNYQQQKKKKNVKEIFFLQAISQFINEIFFSTTFITIY